MSTMKRAHKRIALLIGVAAFVSLFATLVLPSTFGAFSATTTNASNSFTAGTLKMDNSVTGAVVTVGADFKPGDSKTGTVSIKNSGSLPATLKLSESSVTHSGPAGSSDLSAQLDLVVKEGSTTLWSGKFNAVPAAGVALPPTAGTAWASNESHTYTFVVTFPDSDNTYQGTTASASFVWDAAQTAGVAS